MLDTKSLIEKIFIKHSEAIYLNNLGFKEKCIAYYDENGEFLPMGVVYTPIRGYFGTITPKIGELGGKSTPCPLYQQAFEFLLRKVEKHLGVGYMEIRSDGDDYKLYDITPWDEREVISGIDECLNHLILLCMS